MDMSRLINTVCTLLIYNEAKTDRWMLEYLVNKFTPFASPVNSSPVLLKVPLPHGQATQTSRCSLMLTTYILTKGTRPRSLLVVVNAYGQATGYSTCFQITVVFFKVMFYHGFLRFMLLIYSLNHWFSFLNKQMASSSTTPVGQFRF